MKTVAIISEFNPFHNGHARLVSSVRAAYGFDTCIIAIMGGNYTQRGDVAIADKFTRAAMAIEGGIDLVLELPFPYSVSSAEYFSTAGIRLASALGIIDTIAFGSECGDTALLSRVAERLSSREFKESFMAAVKTQSTVGHPKLTEMIYASLFGKEEADVLREPNNVLAIEYLKANNALSSPLSVFTVKRRGGYHDTTAKEGVSATAVRHAILSASDDAKKMIPPVSYDILQKALVANTAPTALSNLGNIFLSHFRLTAISPGDALGHRLQDAAIRATDFEEFTTYAATKRYTHSHIRRSLWHRYLGITSAELSAPPAYTQILGMNHRGREALRRAKRVATLALLTKPADASALNGEAARQAQLAQKADFLFPLSMPTPTAGNAALLASPYRKE